MKRNLLVIFFTLTFTGNLFAQNPLVKQWDYRFGGISYEWFYSFHQTQEGGYILGGRSTSDISGDKTQPNWNPNGSSNDYWIIKIDSLGIKQWDKDFGGTKDDYLISVLQTTDGGYILGGYSNSGISGNKTEANWDTINPISQDYWIIKINQLGIKQWDRDLGGTNNDYFASILQTNDGGYLVGGYSNSNVSGNKTQNSKGNDDYWIVKIDSLGNIQWDKDFGGNKMDQLTVVNQATDGGYILGGSSKSGISGDKTEANKDTNNFATDYWIIKTDSLGNKVWDKDFGGTHYDYLYSLNQTTDGGYILGGISLSDSSGDKTQNTWHDSTIYTKSDYWIIKIDSLGNKEWDKDFGGTDYEDEFGNISQLSDGGYLIAGTSYSDSSGNKTENNLGMEQTWVVKTDSLGNLEWDKTLQTNSTWDDEIGLAIQTKDGCIAMANSTNGGIGGDKSQPSWNNTLDYWIIKFCDTTSTTSIAQTLNYSLSFSICPNPAESILTITLNKNKKITVINLLGEIMIEKNILSVTNGRVDLDITFLSAGIYFIKAGNEVKKFVKE